MFFLSFQIPKESENSHLLERASFDAARYTDTKLVLIPLCFILLRVWGTIRFFMLLRTPTLRFSGPISRYEVALIYMQVGSLININVLSNHTANKLRKNNFSYQSSFLIFAS